MKTIKIELLLLVFTLTTTVLTVSASGEKDVPTLMQQDVIEEEYGDPVASVFGSDYDPESIQTITFLSTLKDMPSDAWDVSEAQDDSVMAWVTPTDDNCYDLYIAGDGDSVNAPADCSYLFAFPNLKTINFNDCFLTDNADNMSEMFFECGFLEELDVSNFDTTNVTDMGLMFFKCSSLEELDLSTFVTFNVEDMAAMFEGCSSLEKLDLSNFDTSNVTNMIAMFYECYSLEELDLSNFDTSKVTDMTCMFYECISLKTLDISNFDIQSTTDTEDMFESCYSLEDVEDGESGLYEEPDFTDEEIIFSLDNFKKTVDTTLPEMEASVNIVLPERYNEIEVSKAKINAPSSLIDERLEEDCNNHGITFISAENITDEQAEIITDQRYRTAEEYLNAVTDQLSIYCTYEYELDIFLKMLYENFPEDYDSDELIMCMVKDAGITEPSDEAYEILMAECGSFNYRDLHRHYTKDELVEMLYIVTLVKEIVAPADAEVPSLTLMKQMVYADSVSVFGSEYDPYSILTITFLDTLEDMPSDAWDVSTAQDGSVMAWATPTDDNYYDLYIAGDGDSVNAPADCTCLFAFPNLESINFNDCFITNKVYDMQSMFYYCSLLQELDLSNFNTTNVTDMGGMFRECSSLEELDLSNFDTSNVTDMSYMFYECSSLKTLDISNFDIQSTTDTEDMFEGCTSLENVKDGDSGLYIGGIQEETEAVSETDENTEEISGDLSQGNANTGEDFNTDQDQTEIVTAENTEDENGSSTIDIEQDYGDWVECIFASGSYYQGFEKDDELNGWGRYTFDNGARYEGQFKDDNFTGFGILTVPSDNFLYVGEYNDGKQSGLGVGFLADDNYLFIGERGDNGLNGLAVELFESLQQFGTYEDGVLVENGYENCRQNDDGSLYYWVDQDNSSGENKGIVMNTDDLRIGVYPEGTSGKSLEFLYDGDLYIGDLNNDVYEGEGIYYYDTSDDIVYAIGSFENGEFTQGIMEHSDGSWEIGQFQNDVYVEGSGITSDDV